MDVTYEVWDTGTSNQIGSFASQAEAEALLRDVLRVNGSAVAREMVIIAYAPNDEGDLVPTLVIDGESFVAHAASQAR